MADISYRMGGGVFLPIEWWHISQMIGGGIGYFSDRVVAYFLKLGDGLFLPFNRVVAFLSMIGW